MGDVIHILPALTDASKAIPDLVVDFVVEKPFSEIPMWHKSIRKVIPVSMRKWRKNVWSARDEIKECFSQIRECEYDLVIDAQGLGKSALLSALAKGERHGYDENSIRESFASKFYQHKHTVNMQEHAVNRIRQLFSLALGYQFDSTVLDYGINESSLKTHFELPSKPYVLLFHGTTWLAKEWPEKNWQKLALELSNKGLEVLIPWGNNKERDRANRISKDISNARVLGKMALSDLAILIKSAKYTVAVDTGLGHLAAALSTPTVSIYGPTNTALIGTAGKNQKHICADTTKFDSSMKNKPYDYGKVTPSLVLTSLDTFQ